MAKKNANGRKARGAAGIATVDGASDFDHDSESVDTATHVTEVTPAKRERKPKVEQQPAEAVSVGDIRKAAAFVNSIGGLDKALAVLQILKVAKEVR